MTRDKLEILKKRVFVDTVTAVERFSLRAVALHGNDAMHALDAVDTTELWIETGCGQTYAAALHTLASEAAAASATSASLQSIHLRSAPDGRMDGSAWRRPTAFTTKW